MSRWLSIDSHPRSNHGLTRAGIQWIPFLELMWSPDLIGDVRQCVSIASIFIRCFSFAHFYRPLRAQFYRLYCHDCLYPISSRCTTPSRPRRFRCAQAGKFYSRRRLAGCCEVDWVGLLFSNSSFISVNVPQVTSSVFIFSINSGAEDMDCVFL